MPEDHGAGTTFHLVPLEVWRAQLDERAPYRASSLESEGFAHCTTGMAELCATGDRYYRSDPRPFVILTIDLARLSVPWRYDAPGTRYPHVYGPIDRSAIVRTVAAPRDASGQFLPFEP